MKFKKLLASSLLCGLCIFSSIPVHASEVEGPDTGIQRTEAALTDGVTRASWGTGTLIHENPLGRKPWAYAKTSTYAGNAYSIKARTKVTSGGYTDYTSWATKSNASSVTSGIFPINNNMYFLHTRFLRFLSNRTFRKKNGIK